MATASGRLDAHQKPPEQLKALFKKYQKATKDDLKNDASIIDFQSPIFAHVGVEPAGAISPRDIQCAFEFLSKDAGNNHLHSLANQSDAHAYAVHGLPGLLIIPYLLSQPMQIELLDKMLHRDLVDPNHKTNLHLHYDMSLNDSAEKSYVVPESRDPKQTELQRTLQQVSKQEGAQREALIPAQQVQQAMIRIGQQLHVAQHQNQQTAELRARQALTIATQQLQATAQQLLRVLQPPSRTLPQKLPHELTPAQVMWMDNQPFPGMVAGFFQFFREAVWSANIKVYGALKFWLQRSPAAAYIATRVNKIQRMHFKLLKEQHQKLEQEQQDQAALPRRQSLFSANLLTMFPPKDPHIHKELSLRRVLEKKLRWLTVGGQYDWTTKKYPEDRPPLFPSDIAGVLKTLFPYVDPQAAILNFYSPGDTLSVHRDVSEECDRGLISLSFGCDAIFVVGNEDGSQTATIRLRSGDALIMSNPSRFAWHGVPKVLAGTCPGWLEDWPMVGEQGSDYEPWKGWMAGKRINLNVRQMNDLDSSGAVR